MSAFDSLLASLGVESAPAAPTPPAPAPEPRLPAIDGKMVVPSAAKPDTLFDRFMNEYARPAKPQFPSAVGVRG